MISPDRQQGFRAYADLGAPGHRVDVIAALQDMIAYNDGKPLSCYAEEFLDAVALAFRAAG